ncbi:hypothetical protein PCYB_042780 [Plasmodium cynomolgi strain B]|uniref:Plasmodium RESA N-terminal domain-containing protein n=1 Tax=Plasmodium cynomolgi (strain B) TaxID=1120755 RepID=K6UQF8_PLACD|nr:hypothetical protein PCYB_042780 [Plasmodium cynomolgi strain B]GAB65074.1 hypothetical protein PCYB_042780 [Plasmodium cynomolgi strain B]
MSCGHNLRGVVFVLAIHIHKDDFERQNAAAKLQVSNKVPRNLAAEKEGTQSGDELELEEMELEEGEEAEQNDEDAEEEVNADEELEDGEEGDTEINAREFFGDETVKYEKLLDDAQEESADELAKKPYIKSFLEKFIKNVTRTDIYDYEYDHNIDFSIDQSQESKYPDIEKDEHGNRLPKKATPVEAKDKDDVMSDITINLSKYKKKDPEKYAVKDDLVSRLKNEVIFALEDTGDDILAEEFSFLLENFFDDANEEKKVYVGSGLMDDQTYFSKLQELYDEIDNDDKKEKEKKEKAKMEEELEKQKYKESKEGKKKEKKKQKKLCRMGKIVKKYAEDEPKNIERSLRYDREEHIDDPDEMEELLFGEFKTLEKYGTHKTSTFYYEMTCFDERLRNHDINTKLEEMNEVPEKWQLLSLYWQSYRNERHKYLAVKKYLLQKFLDLKQKEGSETPQKFNKRWKKCEEIVDNNFTKQHEHINDVFYTFVAKENLSKHEFKEILKDVRNSWKEVTLKTKDECLAHIEGSIVLKEPAKPQPPPAKGLSFWKKFKFNGFFA